MLKKKEAESLSIQQYKGYKAAEHEDAECLMRSIFRG